HQGITQLRSHGSRGSNSAAVLARTMALPLVWVGTVMSWTAADGATADAVRPRGLRCYYFAAAASWLMVKSFRPSYRKFCE
ncbi:hypothetical protein, partial [Nocardia salmonicida]|uniref:hypothetical protein n=1 Tax=Nocardia salmonicida TaxID=53431 RepID=UPI0033E6D7A1